MINKKISKTELIKQVISLEHELNRKPMKRDNISLNYYARKLFGSWNNLMKAAGYEVRFYQKIDSIKFNGNFAYFLGLLITDGHIYYNKDLKCYKVAIYTSYFEEKEMLLKLIKDLFNYNAPVTSRMHGFNKRPNYEIRIDSKNLAVILINDFDIPSGAKSSKISIPKKIKNGPTQFKRDFLRGIIDGDGSLSKQSIRIYSECARYLLELKDLLKQLNVSSGSVRSSKKNTKVFVITISKHQDLLKIKSIYNAEYCYKRKKEIIDKV